MKKLLLMMTLSLIWAAQSADIEAGKAKSAVCTICHGQNGIGMTPMYPNLAGQKAPYLEKQIKAFRDGIRQDPTMKPMVAPLSDEDIANIAAYYADLPADGK